MGHCLRWNRAGTKIPTWIHTDLQHHRTLNQPQMKAHRKRANTPLYLNIIMPGLKQLCKCYLNTSLFFVRITSPAGACGITFSRFKAFVVEATQINHGMVHGIWANMFKEFSLHNLQLCGPYCVSTAACSTALWFLCFHVYRRLNIIFLFFFYSR